MPMCEETSCDGLLQKASLVSQYEKPDGERIGVSKSRSSDYKDHCGQAVCPQYREGDPAYAPICVIECEERDAAVLAPFNELREGDKFITASFEMPQRLDQNVNAHRDIRLDPTKRCSS